MMRAGRHTARVACATMVLVRMATKRFTTTMAVPATTNVLLAAVIYGDGIRH